MQNKQLQTGHYSTNILQELDLHESYQADVSGNETRKSPLVFSWVNMANRSLTIANLFKVIRTSPNLMPPRTGHIGNWSDIINGYIGQRNDNTIICKEQKLGYPLLFDLTQTEDEQLKKGDVTYLPGSIVQQGKHEKLQLFTWEGTQFVERTREHPLFVPFVLASREDKLAPLIQIHKEGYCKFDDVHFQIFSSIIYQKRNFIKEILSVLVEEIRLGMNPRNELARIVDRIVMLDGQVLRGTINIEGRGFIVGRTQYKNTNSFVDAILLPYIAASKPEEFFPFINNAPKEIPLLSNHFIVLLTAILHTDYPEQDEYSVITQPPCNVHIQWGGIAMAGYPPKNSGYFSSREVRYLRNIHKQIIRHFNEIDPIFFILLPSSIFLLWPSTTHMHDVELVEQLIDLVHQNTDNHLELELVYSEIERLVKLWTSQAQQKLSTFFISRFSGKPPVLAIDKLPRKSGSIEPKGFSTLTFQQASMIVGALFDSFSPLQQKITS
jgi:hypothetical protein